MVEIAQVKVAGLSISGLAANLKRHHKGAVPPNLPDALKSYFAKEPAPLDWYPLADYLALLDLALAVNTPKEKRFEVCVGFGAFAGKRDAGVPAGPGAPPREVNPHFRLSVDRTQGLPVVVRRVLSMRERYYNRGFYRVKRMGKRDLEITLYEFPTSEELFAISTGYLRELFLAADPGSKVQRIPGSGTGGTPCRWQLSFSPATETASLSAFE
jgi:hypothetical protein